MLAGMGGVKLADGRLAGKVAAITGGGDGFGKRIAQLFASEGASVAICDINLPAAEKVISQIAADGGQGMAFEADVTDNAALLAFVEAAVARFGRLDVWVGNAGRAGGSDSADVVESEYRQMIDLNLSAVFFGAQFAGRQMIAQGEGGRIINMASVAGYRGIPKRAAYCASKAGVVMTTYVLAEEWAKHDIRVNSISPGYADTPLFWGSAGSGSRMPLEQLMARVPTGKLITVEQVARAALYLASDDSDAVTGLDLRVDGGLAVGNI